MFNKPSILFKSSGIVYDAKHKALSVYLEHVYAFWKFLLFIVFRFYTLAVCN